MPSFKIKFKDQPVLNIHIDETEVGSNYYKLLKDNYHRRKPIFRDPARYSIKYLHELAIVAKKSLGWNWVSESYDNNTSATLHKDLEVFLKNGFANIPEEYDNLMHELHYGLHVITNGGNTRDNTLWLQLEWFNDDGFPLQDDFQFRHELKVGDIRLQNPWVGHGPLQIYMERDFSKIHQTCKFHDFVRPGINIAINNNRIWKFEAIMDAFKTNVPDFVEKHGIEKIARYTGHPVIGHVTNIDSLLKAIEQPYLEFECMIFD